MKRRAVFLDRDGTINEDVGYPGRVSQIHIFPSSFEAVRKINRLDFLAIVLTNQSGVGRGLFTEEDLEKIHRHIHASFSERQARIDAIYFCPHHEQAEILRYRKKCPCRKPNPEMALMAAAAFDIDLGKSYVIGDKVEDIRLGKAILATPILVLTGYGRSSLAALKDLDLEPAAVAPDLSQAVDWILAREKLAARIKSAA